MRYIRWVVAVCMAVSAAASVSAAVNVEGMSSAGIVKKAWEAFNRGDDETAIEYARGCLRFFGDEAARMQAGLDDYPSGSNDAIHAYYALNDVATALYIEGEAQRRLGRIEAAKAAYRRLVEEFSFGQCWDPRGWFWRPAEVAREKLGMLETGKYMDFGDYSSATLMRLAWKALDERDMDGVLAYTGKCIELYEERARRMQEELSGIPKGPPEEIHRYWALNDVATAYFIRGEAFFKTDQLEKAREAYQTVLDRFPYAQCWDPRGWFWRVADGAAEKIEMIDTGVFMDFWDYTSGMLTTKAWKALKSRDYVRARGYADKCIALYADKAREMQAGLEDYPRGDDEELHAYWALNDVATAHFIKGESYFLEMRYPEARKEFETVRDEYSFGQCWDPKGWWWKPAVEAENRIRTIESLGTRRIVR